MKLNDLTTVNYRKVLAETHSLYKWGNAGRHHVDEVVEWAEKLGASSVLDYGCGRGSLKKVIDPIWPVAEYDPGVPGKDEMPMAADLVVCTDVLEHIEPDMVRSVLRHIRTLSLKGSYLTIATSLAGLVLPDGRNAHLSVHDKKWWMEELHGAGFNIVRTENRKAIYVWARV